MCSEIKLNNGDGYLLSARTMDFHHTLRTDLQIIPRGIKYGVEIAPGVTAVGESSKYGYIAARCFEKRAVTEGMNDKGLSLGMLWMNGTVYQLPDGISEKQVVTQGVFMKKVIPPFCVFLAKK